MKLKTLYIFIFFISQISFSQTIFGKWKTIDDETGKEKSIVEIFEKQGKIYGKIWPRHPEGIFLFYRSLLPSFSLPFDMAPSVTSSLLF